MIINKNFPGANITVQRIDGDTVYLENQLEIPRRIGFTGRSVLTEQTAEP